MKGIEGGTTGYSYSVQYNKSLTNAQGGVELTVRSYNDRYGNTTGSLHMHKIKSNAISGFSIKNATAGFNSKANIVEITNNVEQSMEGNCTLQMTMYDANVQGATAGSKDSLSVIVYRNAGGVWYASKWDGTKCVQRAVNVYDGTSAVSVSGNAGNNASSLSRNVNDVSILDITPHAAPAVDNVMFTIVAYPNPFIRHFNFKLSSSSLNKITARVTDLSGRVIEIRENLFPGETIQLGSNYTPKIYLVDVIQGNNRRQVKLVKGK